VFGKGKAIKVMGVVMVALMLLPGRPAEARGFRGGFGGFRGFSRSSSWGRRSSFRRSSSWGRRSTSSRRSRSMSRAARSRSYAAKKMTPKQRRALRVKNRKYTRQLKSNQRKLVRRQRIASRNTYDTRLAARRYHDIAYVPTYSVYSYDASRSFMNGLLIGGAMIYFHDYYNHRLYHSWLWYHHHRDYDISHWPQDKQRELQQWRDYYENQGIQPDKNYVDPGTSRDTDYIKDYVDKHPDEFYGAKASEVTVEELPDESGGPPGYTEPPEREYKVTVERSTSGGTWFLLIFGAICVAGVVAFKLYNQGYF